MYSRYSKNTERPLQIPEHYSGCAFSPSRSAEPPTHYLEVGKPSLPEEETRTPPPLASEELRTATEGDAAPPDAAPQEIPASASSHPLGIPNPFSKLAGALPFSNGLEFDQLLLLGLILLLMKNEEGSDVVLWLALLLLCG